MSGDAWLEIGAVVIAAVLGTIGWLAIRVLRSVERRLDAVEEEVKELRRQATNHDIVTERVATLVEGLTENNKRLEELLTRLESRFIDHLTKEE